MYKEIIITVIIVMLVIVGDIITCKYTESCVSELNLDFESLRNEIIGEVNTEILKKDISGIEEKWDQKREILVYYLEHDELEKVTTAICEIRGYIEIDELKESIPKIDNCKFLLNHIKDKESFTFKNIF